MPNKKEVWISVLDYMPESNLPVQVTIDIPFNNISPTTDIAEWYPEKGNWHTNCYVFSAEQVSHWKPLSPPAPGWNNKKQAITHQEQLLKQDMQDMQD